MVGNSKVIYLQKEDGRSIKAYVVCYLLDNTTNKTYVIVANQNGKNAKGYEVVGKQAVVLSAEDSSIFKGYKTNPNFSDVTDAYEDGIHLELVKEAKVETVEEAPIEAPISDEKESVEEEKVAVVYYVYDKKSLNAYKASLSTSNVLSDIHFLKSWDDVTETDIPKIVNENQYPEPAFVIYDKETDLEYGSNGTVIPLKWTAVSDIPYEAIPDMSDIAFEEIEEHETSETPLVEESLETPKEVTEEPIEQEKIDSLEEVTSVEEEKTEAKPELIIDGEPIIFYVYDQNVVKKYSAILIDKKDNEIEVKDIKTLEVITGADNLDVNRFLAKEEVELGAYFVNYDDYNPTIENINGNLIATATLNNALCKTEEIAQLTFDDEPEQVVSDKKEERKILVFNSDIDVYENQTHYTIWGCFCTLISEEPLTVIPDKNGVKTVIYEDEKSNSINEVCQNYQNLYPNVSVYLTDTEVKGNDAITLNEYTAFKPQAEKENATLLENGRKILTEEEMIAKRQKELENLKKK